MQYRLVANDTLSFHFTLSVNPRAFELFPLKRRQEDQLVKERRKVWKKKRPVAVTIVAWGIVLLFLIRLYQVYEPLSRLGCS